MGVPIGVHHELDAAFNTVLLTFGHLIEDGVDYLINAILTDCDDSLNHAMLHIDIVWINLCICSGHYLKYSLISTLYYNGVHYLVHELYMWVHLCGPLLVNYYLSCSLESELLLCLSEHSLLLSRNSLSFCLFLFSDVGLVLGDLITPALSAPSLALTWTEIVDPSVALSALDSDNGLVAINDAHLGGASMAYRLAADGSDDLDTVVADLMLGIGELPESDAASTARLLCTCTTLLVIALALTNFNSRMSVTLLWLVNWAIASSDSIRLRALVFSAGLSAASVSYTCCACGSAGSLSRLACRFCCHLCEIWFVCRCTFFLFRFHADLGKDIVNSEATWLLWLRMRMRMSMSIGMMMRRMLIAGGSSIISGTSLGSLLADDHTGCGGCLAALLSLEAGSNGVAWCLDGVSGGSVAANSGVLAGLLPNEFLTVVVAAGGWVGLLVGNGDENLLDLTLMLHFSIFLGVCVGV